MSRKPSLSGRSTPKVPVSSRPATPVLYAIGGDGYQESPNTAESEDLEGKAAAEHNTPGNAPVTPCKTPFEEVPFRNVDYKSLTLEDLIQRSARRVKIGPNGEEIQETWIEVKMKLNSRANSELRPVQRAETEGLEEEKRQQLVVSLQEQFGQERAEPMDEGISETPPRPASPIPESPRGSKSVQTDESPVSTPVPAPTKPPRRSARLAKKRALRTQATPMASPSPVVKRKRAQSKPSSVKRPKP